MLSIVYTTPPPHWWDPYYGDGVPYYYNSSIDNHTESIHVLRTDHLELEFDTFCTGKK